MIKLLKSELQRIDLRPYLIGSTIIGIVILGFIYFAAFVAQVEQEGQFMTHGNIFRLIHGISIVLFSILSAAMYGKWIIREYSGERLAQLILAGRNKIVMAKVMIVFLFMALTMLLCTILPMCIFSVTEMFCPIVSEAMTSGILMKALGNIVVSLVTVSAIGLVALRIGFIKRSVGVTLISAFILSGVYGSIAISNTENSDVSLLIAGISMIAILVVFVMLFYKINHMEVE